MIIQNGPGENMKEADYEYEKRIIAETSKSATEYEERIKELTERLKI